MRIFKNPPRETWEDLCRRPLADPAELDSEVKAILGKVKKQGDSALRYYSAEFDHISIIDFKITERELDEAEKFVSDDLKNAIRIASGNIYRFHKSQLRDEETVETMPGVKCWRRNVAIDKVGLYIPGGSAPLFSSVLMLGIPAKIAGCRRVIICTPPGRQGKINPLILYAAKITGISEIFRIGGAQAIAAMAYGTETIPRVDKIFGPGNQYVTKAKEIAASEGTAVDMPAGPSEVLVIAGPQADPTFIAADLISQAEHGPDSQVVLLTDCEKLLSEVSNELSVQLERLPRKDIAALSLDKSMAILLKDPYECIDFSNEYAPEHLIINTDDPHELAGKVISAGSVFLGKYSCESAGDYASGTNHTLPTNRAAKSYSGISTDSFLKKITFQELSREGIEKLGPVIEVMAGAENLAGHAEAVTIRLNSLRQ
ncbi:MAG TPA: histidinol dehydrogenase [Bacteroidales bacterium]|jgi:histidinol dehydrogenase|nr:histidinol dehydrogenase [Bacteroidales bacterium]HQH22732.1 histidinol dehydrogenase [Bacteroidales bacterium]HQJ82116.1 histidinol dehydrogenase [Bacteroidales bacterium]